MIYTRFGGEIEILEYIGEGWCKIKMVEDGAIREWHASEFKADDGIVEIEEAIKLVSK